MTQSGRHLTSYRYSTPWGDGWLGYDGQANAIVALDVPGAAVPVGVRVIDSDAPEPVRELERRISAYLRGERVSLASREELAHWLDVAGVDGFHRKASLALHGVPYGMTVTYGELAELAGYPGAARAAGTTCARNPLPLVIPCHRLLPASGRLGRYGTTGPSYRKRLLQLEGVHSVK